MKVALIIVSIIALAAIGFGGYSYLEQEKMAANLNSLNDKIEEKDFSIDQLKQENERVVNELETKISEISQEKENEINKLKGTYDELVSGMKEEIDEGKIKITRLADRLSVSMVDKILFPSGESQITPEGVAVLERVGNVLKNTQDKIIRVEGHTDNVPISSKLRMQYPTNWELSNARATNVVRFLQDKVEIAPERLEAVGLSEYHPVATNETAEGRSKNRRIEIILLPNIESTELANE